MSTFVCKLNMQNTIKMFNTFILKVQQLICVVVFVLGLLFVFFIGQVITHLNSIIQTLKELALQGLKRFPI